VCYPFIHATSMEPVERTRGERTTMHIFVIRELMESRRAEGRVPMCGMGRGRACRAGADSEGTS